MALQLARVLTVDLHCRGVGSTNQISERFTWQLCRHDFNCIIHTLQCSIPYLSSGTASAWNDGFVRTPAAELCATTTVTVDKTFSWMASAYSQSGISTSVRMQEQVYCKPCVYRWQVTPTIQYDESGRADKNGEGLETHITWSACGVYIRVVVPNYKFVCNQSDSEAKKNNKKTTK